MEHIKQHIEERLWEFIKRSYNSEDYKTAILDSIQFIGDIIREKSGLDNDGNQLIGGALGGTNPKIRLNKLKTESEKNIQKGIESILRGIYSAYRNPRSHSKINDSEQDAFEIIIFINHLIKLIDKSKGKFTTELFLKRVFDNDFVQTNQYANLLIKDIPKNKIFEIAIEIFRQKENGKVAIIILIWEALKDLLSEEENIEILKLVSEELRFTDSLKTVIRCIALFESQWTKIDEDSRLRAENKLIQLIPVAEKDFQGTTNEAGIYASWFTSIIKVSLLRNLVADKIYNSLVSRDKEKQRFVIDFFGNHIDGLEDVLFLDSFKDILKKELDDGNRIIYDWVSNYYGKKKDSDFKKELENFVEQISEDDLPF
ncbi:TIGR02391 family protein [Aureibaculum sp. A20]|uniref:TIGR02391 family protein n=1 Tax=Aureibaculum flavum TaxID=2795986 RepID=A0ABS0WQH2_9FLAO|nr:TIGR02391 family protein [Aureibaculum flavum]MBJ2174184.1 TIGR02391 family protein [Aureibaculum flavum]